MRLCLVKNCLLIVLKALKNDYCFYLFILTDCYRVILRGRLEVVPARSHKPITQVRFLPTATKLADVAQPGADASVGSIPTVGSNIWRVNQSGTGLALKAMGAVSSCMEFDSTIPPPSFRHVSQVFANWCG